MSKRLALILVIIFFLSAIVQGAAIIDYHSESFNLGFYPGNNKSDTFYKTLDESIRERYFKPFEIQVRFDQKTMIIGREDSLFRILWIDAQAVFSDMLAGDMEITTELWDQVCDNPGVSVTFGGYFPIEYLGYMLNAEVPDELDINVDKIMIIPGEEIMTVYLHTDNSAYYKSEIEPRGLFTVINFDNMTELFAKSPDFNTESMMDFYRAYGNNPTAAWRDYVEPDIPISFDVSSHLVPWIYVGLPDSISNFNEYAAENEYSGATEEMDTLSDAIKYSLLTKSVNLFTTHYDSSGNLFFTNQFNMYEINQSGWITYRYTPGTQGDEKGQIGEAFVNAYETLEAIANLAAESPGELYISRIEESDDSYTFKFDYKYDTKVLAIEDEPHAAIITATATRTIEARVLPLVFQDTADDTQIESPYIYDFNTNLLLHGINSLNLIEAYNIYVGYGVFSGDEILIGPVWIFEKHSGEKEVYSLKKGRD